jgi:hypothetical protein
MNDEILAIWKRIKEALWNMGNEAVADGQEYGLRCYADWHRKRFPGSFCDTQWEEPITEGLAQRLAGRQIGDRRIHACTEKRYPASSQKCDLVIGLDGVHSAWIECKTAYKERLCRKRDSYDYNGDAPEPDYWERGVEDIGKDVEKLDSLRPPAARYVGILLLGFDRAGPLIPGFDLPANAIALEQLYGRKDQAGLLPPALYRGGVWLAGHGREGRGGIIWEDRYAPRADRGYRERLWFWYRQVAG